MKFYKIDCGNYKFDPRECGKTMTIQELIEKLSKEKDKETPVYLSDGYAFGSVTDESVGFAEYGEDEV